VNPVLGVYLVWGLWAVSWVAASFWADRATRRPPAATQIPYRAMTLTGFALLFGIVAGGSGEQAGAIQDTTSFGLRLFDFRLWPVSASLGWSMVALAVLGFGFAWWARIHLGRLWSGFVSRKEGHRLVDTGPYRLVRHPIYTGIDAASFAVLVVKASPLALAGFVLVVWGYWLKARIEERFLREELGSEAYDAYARRVPMLVPFSPV
jgi:protein-S-isoprenylcysteine O-methyltransferase Ste14